MFHKANIVCYMSNLYVSVRSIQEMLHLYVSVRPIQEMLPERIYKAYVDPHKA